MVHRVKPFKGNPYWEKKTLKVLGFNEDEKVSIKLIFKVLLLIIIIFYIKIIFCRKDIQYL